MSLVTYIGRGGLAGACAGLLSGLFSLVLAEPTIDRAIELEHAAAGAENGAELYTRDVQHIGLLVASVLTGLAIGMIFGLVYALVHRRDPLADPWNRSLRMAAAGFIGVSLMTFLRYPANPPGVGDPDTVDARTISWLAVIAIGIATMVAAQQAYALLGVRGVTVPMRQLASAAVVIAGFALLFVLPAPAAAGDVSADLLWTFRLFSLAATAIMWAGVGVGFGLAGLRVSHRAVAVA